MSEKLLNVNDVTRGAIAVICSQVLPKDEEGLTVSQAALYLGVSTSVLQSWRKSGKGPECYRKNGKFLYSPSSIRAFISQTNSKNRKVA